MLAPCQPPSSCTQLLQLKANLHASNLAEKKMPKEYLTCCCCLGDAGKWEQHWNRDTGYGVCASCVDWLRSRGESEEEIKRNYGIEGVNWGRPAAQNA